jgi:hypothetical protein
VYLHGAVPCVHDGGGLELLVRKLEVAQVVPDAEACRVLPQGAQGDVDR